jgi:hypothetical protein
MFECQVKEVERVPGTSKRLEKYCYFGRIWVHKLQIFRRANDKESNDVKYLTIFNKKCERKANLLSLMERYYLERPAANVPKLCTAFRY